jgi:hypothetical protein
MLDCLERDHHIDGTVWKWNPLSASRPGVKPVLASSMKTSLLGDVDANYMCGASFLKRRTAISFATGHIQDTLSCHKARGKGIPVRVLPKGKFIGDLRYHSLPGVVV